MASRKTSTTQRRQNLLRSVESNYAGTRLVTNGSFRLGPQSLTEVSRLTGRVRNGSYFLVREELRKILRDNPTEPSILTYRHNSTGASTYMVEVRDDMVRIGCKRFMGKNATALKQWALRTK